MLQQKHLTRTLPTNLTGIPRRLTHPSIQQTLPADTLPQSHPLKPRPPNPPIKELQARFRLIERHHVPTAMTTKGAQIDQPTTSPTRTRPFLEEKKEKKEEKGRVVHSHKGKVAAALDLADLPTVAIELQILELDVVVRLLAGPLERLRPRVVAEPVADEIGVALLRAAIEGLVVSGVCFAWKMWTL